MAESPLPFPYSPASRQPAGGPSPQPTTTFRPSSARRTSPARHTIPACVHWPRCSGPRLDYRGAGESAAVCGCWMGPWLPPGAGNVTSARRPPRARGVRALPPHNGNARPVSVRQRPGPALDEEGAVRRPLSLRCEVQGCRTTVTVRVNIAGSSSEMPFGSVVPGSTNLSRGPLCDVVHLTVSWLWLALPRPLTCSKVNSV